MTDSDHDGIPDYLEPLITPSTGPQTPVPRTDPNSLEHLLVGPLKPDLAVTTDAHTWFTTYFNDYREALDQQRKNIKSFDDLPDVVTYNSAIETNRHLNKDARDSVLDTLDKYIAYLDEYKDTVDKAIRKIQAEG